MLKNLLKKLPSAQAGFSLIEMLIVIALMALVGTFVAGNVIRKYDQAKVDATRIQMKQLGVILDDFRRVCGFYPTTDQGLEALVKAPSGRECKNYDPEGFIKDKRVPKDAWDHDFDYVSDGSKYTLRTLGADGKEGGDGFDKDFGSDES
ncbi:MAG: type II secretion system major pseudopilin GspG [Oligoflexia bacterium]|nr:type II secretion system major pseudopilin GspG [Oligoflexia bacterium]